MKHIVLISRIAGGLLFLFSGFVKGIDPIGSQVKFGDYFIAAGADVPEIILLIMAMALCFAEFMIGLLLITGWLYRYAVYGYAIFMGLFTPLTLIIAIFDPVSDCGCFGDAIIMSNWETFFKNLLFIIPAVIMVQGIRKEKAEGTGFKNITETTLASLLFILFMVWNLIYLPIIDFRPYSIGVNIEEAMSIPPDAPQAVYDIRLVYEREGQKREFTLDDYPADDTSWVFVEQIVKVIEEGYTPPITSFEFISPNESNETYRVLQSPGYVLLMIVPDLEKAGSGRVERGISAGKAASENGIGFWLVTSTTGSLLEQYRESTDVLLADQITLKTIVRTNPGYLLLREGTIVAKWSYASLPAEEWFSGSLTGKRVGELNRYRQGVILALFVAISVIAIFIARRHRRCGHNSK